jgi:hypothetical protein
MGALGRERLDVSIDLGLERLGDASLFPVLPTSIRLNAVLVEYMFVQISQSCIYVCALVCRRVGVCVCKCVEFRNTSSNTLKVYLGHPVST